MYQSEVNVIGNNEDIFIKHCCRMLCDHMIELRLTLTLLMNGSGMEAYRDFAHTVQLHYLPPISHTVAYMADNPPI